MMIRFLNKVDYPMQGVARVVCRSMLTHSGTPEPLLIKQALGNLSPAFSGLRKDVE